MLLLAIYRISNDCKVHWKPFWSLLLLLLSEDKTGGSRTETRSQPQGYRYSIFFAFIRSSCAGFVQIPFDDYDTGSSSDHHSDDDSDDDDGDDEGHDSSHGSATERTLYLKIFNALIGVSVCSCLTVIAPF